MPTSERCGTPSLANDTIGGIPTILYFDFASRGRGQVVRLLFEDAGIAYDDIRYSFDEYPEYKSTKIAGLNPVSQIPVVELNGRVLTQSYAILRHLARVLGKYDGEDEEGRYRADVVCDIVVDWRTLFISAFFSPDKDITYPEHQRTTRDHYLKAIESILTSSDLARQGDYVIGNTFTYADMVLYQILHDENLTQDGRKGLQAYPRLMRVVDAVEGRENIRRFLESGRYRG